MVSGAKKHMKNECENRREEWRMFGWDRLCLKFKRHIDVNIIAMLLEMIN